MSAAVHPRPDAVAAALASEFHVVFDTIELATRPGGQVPDQGRLDALEVVRSRIRGMINVRQVVSVRFREVHGHVVLEPGNIANGRALHPAHDANVRRIVHVTVIRDQLLDKRWRRY